jgi:hypothetical protein
MKVLNLFVVLFFDSKSLPRTNGEILKGADEPSSLCLLNVYRQLYEKFSAKNDYINASRIAEQCLSLSAGPEECSFTKSDF